MINKTLDENYPINYEDLIYIFYEHLSNRNLALLISKLYNKDINSIYFEIDKIISQKKQDIQVINTTIDTLNQNGFQEWIEEED